jgi:cobalt-zinc-cadmium efflux system protein
MPHNARTPEDHAGHDHDGHDHAGHDHDGHDHAGHDHDGHDHAGHDHAGHDHAGHDHAGHDHAGHDHAGHDHAGHAAEIHDTARHADTPKERRQRRRLTFVLVITSLFFCVEYIGAWKSGSAVLQADALHLLMDIGALGLSLFAMRLARRPRTADRNFGYLRAEPLTALLNAVLVLATALEIVRDGASALVAHKQPEPTIMLVVAAIALGVNGLSAWLIHGAMHGMPGAHAHAHDHGHTHGNDEHGHDEHGHDHGHAGHSLNLRGVWLHLLGDALGSLAALVAALVIRFGGPAAIDPIASFFVAAILTVGGWRLLRDALRVLSDAAPKLRKDGLREALAALPGVAAVVDLHVWTVGAGTHAAMVRLRAAPAASGLASKAATLLKREYGVEIANVQIDD